MMSSSIQQQSKFLLSSWSTTKMLMMMLLLSLSSLLLVVNGDQKLSILSPGSLAARFRDGVPLSPALFGIPPMRGSVTGMVVQAPLGNRDACSPIDTSKVYGWPVDTSQPFVVIVLAERGNCSFTTKVQHVQDAKGSAAVIMDNIYEDFMPIMADDGSGQSIDIPSVFIGRTNGEAIKSAINDTIFGLASPVMVTIAYNVPRPDNRVEFIFFTSSHEPDLVDFKQTFANVAQVLGADALMIPKFFLLNGSYYGCRPSSGRDVCGGQCTNHGRYCAVDPEHDIFSGLDSADVIMENVRQFCLWNYVNTTGEHQKWWTYINLFQTNCATNDSVWTEECSYAQMTTLNLPREPIAQCVTNSGGFGDNDNMILNGMLTDVNNYFIKFIPRFFINDDPYYGRISCPSPINLARCDLLRAICYGFADASNIAACNSDCDLGVTKDVCGVCGGNGTTCVAPSTPTDTPSNSGISVGVVFAIVIPIVLVTVALAIWYIRRQRQKTRLDLDRILQSYIPIDENNPNKRTRDGSVSMQNVDVRNPVTTTGEERSQLIDEGDSNA